MREVLNVAEDFPETALRRARFVGFYFRLQARPRPTNRQQSYGGEISDLIRRSFCRYPI